MDKGATQKPVRYEIVLPLAVAILPAVLLYLAAERMSMMRSNKQLRSEVHSLRSINSQVLTYEKQLKLRLEELAERGLRNPDGVLTWVRLSQTPPMTASVVPNLIAFPELPATPDVKQVRFSTHSPKSGGCSPTSMRVLRSGMSPRKCSRPSITTTICSD